MNPRYHHGDLPNALRSAAGEVIAEKGLGGFSLREVARRANVSHTAPAHHFGDMTGLLTSLAITGFDALYQAQVDAIGPEDSAADRLAAAARAYVTLADANPGVCQVMFRIDVVNTDDPNLQAAGKRSYDVLAGLIDDLIAEEGLSVNANDVTSICWCTMQGLVVLRTNLELIDGFRGVPAQSTTKRITRFIDLLLKGIRQS